MVQRRKKKKKKKKENWTEYGTKKCVLFSVVRRSTVYVCVRVNACWMGDWVDGGIDSWSEERKRKERRKKNSIVSKHTQSTGDASLSSLIYTGSLLTGRFCQGWQKEKGEVKRKKEKKKKCVPYLFARLCTHQQNTCTWRDCNCPLLS